MSDGSIDTSGYIAASDAYFGRGSIPLTWNYDYYGASQALSGNPDLLCDNPDLVSTNSMIAWGVGIYKWMEKMTFGTTGSTSHKQVLKETFGGTIKVLYGDLECPSNEWSSAAHVGMVKDRVAEICKSGSALGVYLNMDQCSVRGDCLQCEGLADIFESCQVDGTCPECPSWPDFVKSAAPTVTPLRVESPTFGDWDYVPRGRASALSSPRYALAFVFFGGTFFEACKSLF